MVYWFSLLTILSSIVLNMFFEKVYSTLIQQTLTTDIVSQPKSYKPYKIDAENYKYLYYN